MCHFWHARKTKKKWFLLFGVVVNIKDKKEYNVQNLYNLVSWCSYIYLMQTLVRFILLFPKWIAVSLYLGFISSTRNTMWQVKCLKNTGLYKFIKIVWLDVHYFAEILHVCNLTSNLVISLVLRLPDCKAHNNFIHYLKIYIHIFHNKMVVKFNCTT